jgi:hypothetical protein
MQDPINWAFELSMISCTRDYDLSQGRFVPRKKYFISIVSCISWDKKDVLKISTYEFQKGKVV